MHKLDETELHLESNLTLLKYRQALHLLTLMYHRSKHEGNLNNRDLRTGQFDKVKFKVITSVTKKGSLGALMQDKGRCQNSRVANYHQLLQPLAKGHGKVPQEHIISLLECHILLVILIVCWHTSSLAVLIIFIGNQLRVNFTEGRRKLPVSTTVSGEF